VSAVEACCFALLLLTPCALAGLALMNTGLSRSRNAAHAMLGALCVVSVAALAWFALGYSLLGHTGGASRILVAGGRSWDWIGRERLLLRGVDFDAFPASLEIVFGLAATAMAAMIPLGSGGERWRLGASCASSAITAGLTFPLFAHWAWGTGWLAGLGFVDSGGGAAIHAAGGMSALAVAWILGPRRGKYGREGAPAAFPGHHAVLLLLGCFLAWIGWLGFDCAGALLHAGMQPARAVQAAVNTTLSAAAAGLSAASVTRLRFRKTDASLTANGWTAGLVAASAGCASMRPSGAVLVGMVAGVLAIFAIETLELRLFVDDPAGAIAVHGIAGIWGVMAVALLGSGSWLAQVAGVATVVGFVLPLTYGLNWTLDRFYRQRAPGEAERQGLDLHELGAGAYPDFVSHNDDTWLH
jgi:Amt family ammonium transporter